MTHGFIRTFLGKKIDPTNPTIDDICVVDIAHGLAFQPRWGGQGDFGEKWYSIAEHSVLVSGEVYRRTNSYRLALDALMHDAPEAYLLDIPRPIKCQLGESYATLETKFALVIEEVTRAIIDPMPEPVKAVDDQILHNEANAFMQAAQRADPEWQLGRDPIPDLELHFWQPEMAEYAFLKQYNWFKAKVLMS